MSRRGTAKPGRISPASSMPSSVTMRATFGSCDDYTITVRSYGFTNQTIVTPLAR
jgi:hypothetical protein